MAMGRLLGAALLLIAVAVPRVEPYRATAASPQVATIGTFAAADNTCFLKKIFKGQPSPVTFNHVAATNIVYVNAVTDTRNAKGGVSLSIIAGALASPTITVQIDETAAKSFFLNDITVTMRCAP